MRTYCTLALILGLFVLAPPARAGDAPCQALFGIEGLCRAPVDLSVDFGATFYEYDMDATTFIQQISIYEAASEDSDFQFRINPGPADRGIELQHEALQYGFRLSGGISYERWGVTFEPAMAFQYHDPVGAEKDRGPRDRDFIFEGDCCISDPYYSDMRAWSEVELTEGWDLAFGPKISIPSPLSFLPGNFEFFPFLGVSEAKWDAHLSQSQLFFTDTFITVDPETFIRNADADFEETFLLVGFDLDFPLPGSTSSFTHALVFGFKWLEGVDSGEHQTSERDPFSEAFAPGDSFSLGRANYRFDSIEGYRLEIRYRVTWNDFEGFFKRNVFGPI